MAKCRVDLNACVGELLDTQDGDGLRDGIRVLSQAMIETVVADWSGPRITSCSTSVPPLGTGSGRGRATRGWAQSRLAVRRCARDVFPLAATATASDGPRLAGAGARDKMQGSRFGGAITW